MSLCRMFPSPSDRMAIIWTLMPIEGAVVLEYGPAGTTHFGAGMYSSLGLSLGTSLFTTHISEDDVVMGDVSRLEEAILEIDAAYSPKVIFVVASAVVAVIGTDIEGVCRYMQEKVNARLISFEEGGFRGDYTYGLRSVYRMLADRLAERSETQSGSYVVLGASVGNYRMRSDVGEIRSLMKEAFGFENICSVGLETSVDEIRRIGNAALSLVLRAEALPAAEILKEKYGIPYVYGAPYGYRGTLDWLDRVAEVVGIPVEPRTVARISEKIDLIIPIGGGPMAQMRRKPPKVCVQADYDNLLGIRSVFEDLGFDDLTLVCSHSLQGIPDPDGEIRYYPKERDRIRLFQSLSETWCLGSDEMKAFVLEKNYFTQFSAPFFSVKQAADHLPFMGEKGMDHFRERKAEYFLKFDM